MPLAKFQSQMSPLASPVPGTARRVSAARSPFRQMAMALYRSFGCGVSQRATVLAGPDERQLSHQERSRRIQQHPGIGRPECRPHRPGIHDRDPFSEGDGLPHPLQPLGIEWSRVQRLPLEPEQMPGTVGARRDVKRLARGTHDQRALRRGAERTGVDALDLRVVTGDEIEEAVAAGQELWCRVRRSLRRSCESSFRRRRRPGPNPTRRDSQTG